MHNGRLEQLIHSIEAPPISPSNPEVEDDDQPIVTPPSLPAHNSTVQGKRDANALTPHQTVTKRPKSRALMTAEDPTEHEDSHSPILPPRSASGPANAIAFPKLSEELGMLAGLVQLPENWPTSEITALHLRMLAAEQKAKDNGSMFHPFMLFDAIVSEPGTKEHEKYGFSCWTQKAQKSKQHTIPDSGSQKCERAGQACAYFTLTTYMVTKRGIWNGQMFVPNTEKLENTKDVDGK